MLYFPACCASVTQPTCMGEATTGQLLRPSAKENAWSFLQTGRAPPLSRPVEVRGLQSKVLTLKTPPAWRHATQQMLCVHRQAELLKEQSPRLSAISSNQAQELADRHVAVCQRHPEQEAHWRFANSGSRANQQHDQLRPRCLCGSVPAPTPTQPSSVHRPAHLAVCSESTQPSQTTSWKNSPV